jgi:transcription antitermination factor NusG
MSEPLHKGDQALITSGPFEGQIGTVAEVEGQFLTVVVDIFDRDTAVRVLLADLTAPPGRD